MYSGQLRNSAIFAKILTVYRDGRHVTYMYDVSHDARVQLNLYDHPLRHN